MSRKICLKRLFEILENFVYSEKDIRITEIIYKDPNACIRIENELSKSKQIEKGAENKDESSHWIYLIFISKRS